MPDQAGHDIEVRDQARHDEWGKVPATVANILVEITQPSDTIMYGSYMWSRSGGVAVIELACPPPDTGRGRGPT